MNLVLLRRLARRVVLPKADRRARHIVEVLRRTPATATAPAAPGSSGSSIAIGVANGPIGSAVLRSIDDDDGSITLDCSWPELNPADNNTTTTTSQQLAGVNGSTASSGGCSGVARSGGGLLPLDVVVGLARPETCRKVLRELSTLGVRSMTFVLCQLSDKNYRYAPPSSCCIGLCGCRWLSLRQRCHTLLV